MKKYLLRTFQASLVLCVILLVVVFASSTLYAVLRMSGVSDSVSLAWMFVVLAALLIGCFFLAPKSFLKLDWGSIIETSSLKLFGSDPYAAMNRTRLLWRNGAVAMGHDHILGRHVVTNSRAVQSIEAAPDTETPQKRDTVFLIDSPSDDEWLVKLHKVFYSEQREMKVEAWHISAGSVWRDEISERLRSAKVILFMDSFNLVSDVSVKDDLSSLIYRVQRMGLPTFRVCVSRTSGYEDAIRKIQSLNDPDKPLDTLAPDEVEQELKDIARAVEEVAG